MIHVAFSCEYVSLGLLPAPVRRFHAVSTDHSIVFEDTNHVLGWLRCGLVGVVYTTNMQSKIDICACSC